MSTARLLPASRHPFNIVFMEGIPWTIIEGLAQRAGIKRDADLARALGVTPQVIYNWRQRGTVPVTNIPALIGPLKTTPNELYRAAGNPIHEDSAFYNVENGPTVNTLVPLISWVQAGCWKNIVDTLHPGDYERPVPSTKKVGPRSFALRVRGDSMESEFREGEIIIVDPDYSARNGSFVVVRLEDGEEATFKQLVIDGNRKYLKPINPRYPIIEITKHATICGVVRHSLKDYD